MWPSVVFGLLVQLVHAANLRFYMEVSLFQGRPDGFNRMVYGVNGISPGFTIYADVGDRIEAYVSNNLTNGAGTSIHWHGIQQRQTNNMDGVPYVTQLPIVFGQTFLYNFTFDHAGTYFYHSHFLEQYIQGLRGAIVVRIPTEENVYFDQPILLADWYHDDADYLRDKVYLVPGKGDMEPTPDSALVNSVGQNTTCADLGSCKYAAIRATTASSLCGNFSTYSSLLTWQAQLPELSDESNKLTRLRVINGGAFAVFNFSIDDHMLWVLSIDGQPVVPEITK
jgi:FtsP/CotA-like multicopper oxidase with cupredoxin domain